MIISGFTGGAFAENTYLVRSEESGAAILVDPGAAVDDALAEARRVGAAIGAIVLTHAHLDHVEGLPQAKAALNVPIYLHPDDAVVYENVPEQAAWFGLRADPMPPIDRDLDPDEPFVLGDLVLELRHVPGHAPGHVILVGDGEAVCGDTVFAGSIGRTDLPGGDHATLLRAIRDQVLTLPDETALHPGHGPSTTVGHERVSNPFLAPMYGGSRLA